MFPLVDAGRLANFSGDGRLYRAFDHVVAALHGSVLLVPMYRAAGDLSGLVDGCPVPWDEVDEVLRSERGAEHAFDFDGDRYGPRVMALAALARDGWTLDFMRLRGSAQLVWRLVHRSGVRFACTPDVVYATG
jgi:hypothetical protein